MNVMRVDIILLCLVISETWTFHLQSQTQWFLKLLQFVPVIIRLTKMTNIFLK